MIEPVDVICCGVAALDHIWRVDRLPSGDGKQRAGSYLTQVGGLAANAALAVARLGGKAALWARAGDDDAARRIDADLSAAGVDTSGLRRFSEASSVIAGIFVALDGARMIVSHRGSDLPGDADWLPLDAVAQARAVHADTRWLEGTLALFGAARAAGVPTILDIERTNRDILDRLLPLTDHAIFSWPGFVEFSGGEEIDTGLAAAVVVGAGVAAVTRGADGVAWWDDGQVQTWPAFTVDVIDTTAAGDVFHGAYAFALSEGYPVARAMRFASATAAIKCTRFGGSAGTPTRAEVEAFLTRMVPAI